MVPVVGRAPRWQAAVMILALTLLCAPIAIDGDTLKDCRGQRWRIARIDAPEMPGHCRRGRECVAGEPFAARAALTRMIAGKAVTCRVVDATPERAGFQRGIGTVGPWFDAGRVGASWGRRCWRAGGRRAGGPGRLS